MELDAVADAPALLQPWSVMLHLDSIGGYHKSAEAVLRNWLAHEWSVRRGRSFAIAKRRFSAARMPYMRPIVWRSSAAILHRERSLRADQPRRLSVICQLLRQLLPLRQLLSQL